MYSTKTQQTYEKLYKQAQEEIVEDYLVPQELDTANEERDREASSTYR